MTPPATDPMVTVPLDDIPIPDVEQLVIEDGLPVDSVFSEKQMRLLTEPLYATWSGPGDGRPFLAAANVGVFATAVDPPLVPDVFLVLDTTVKGSLREKKHRSYFLWEHGKPPDVVIEVVSNTEGEELSRRLRGYERMRVPHYVVFDPFHLLSDQELRHFELHGGAYIQADGSILESVGIGLTLWEGEFEHQYATWLRWCDPMGGLIETGCERADSAEQRADSAEQRAQRLATRLRELGIDPEE